MSIREMLRSTETRLNFRLIPLPIRAAIGVFSNAKTLALDYGQYKSLLKKSAIGYGGESIPWYSYPAIEYIKGIDFSEKTVFEYGSGNSTLFWAKRAKSVVAVESSKEWYELIHSKMPENVDYIFSDSEKGYISSISNHKISKFDVIIVDGYYDRIACVHAALPHLSDNGILILDNSERYNQECTKTLRDSDLIQVDMSGFAPNATYTQCTSFFFSRSVKLNPLESQPRPPIGAFVKN